MGEWVRVLGQIFGFVFFVMALYVAAFVLIAVAHTMLCGII